jgi:hypothetical protein
MYFLPYSCTIFAEMEVEKRRASSHTYTEPLPIDSPLVQSFLQEFYNNDVYDLNADLVKYNETVGEHYKYLVPQQVSFDEFCCRYLFRCNVAHILREWAGTVPHETTAIRRPPLLSTMHKTKGKYLYSQTLLDGKANQMETAVGASPWSREKLPNVISTKESREARYARVERLLREARISPERKHVEKTSKCA